MAWPITTDGQPADLTGHTAKCEVRSASSGAGALLATITAAVQGSSVVISWTDVQTREWSWSSGWADVILRDRDSGWVNLPAGAKIDPCYLTVVVGAVATAPTIGSLRVYFR